MPLPRAVARFNKRFTNRFIEPIARLSPGFAVVHHSGRRTGSPYTTPINVFVAGESLIVVLTYGPSADWVQNVRAGGGVLERGSRHEEIDTAAVVGRDVAWPVLPVPVRIALRVLRVHHFLRMSVSSAA